MTLSLLSCQLAGRRQEPRPASAHSSDIFQRVDQGHAIHFMLRSGSTAAHVNVVSGKGSRWLVAFPGGNSGTAVWLKDNAHVSFSKTPTPLPLERIPGMTGDLRGVTFELKTDKTTLHFDSALLGSVRHIRYWDQYRKRPDRLKEEWIVTGEKEVTVSRPSLDGKSFYRMRFRAENGSVRLHDGGVELRGDKPLRVTVQAQSADPVLTPIPFGEILKPEVLARTDSREVELLAFLIYREKFLAGSWTYLTYFGRDTLMSLALLLPALTPAAAEAMLGAVIDRLNSNGEVAHEEEIGDYASFESLRSGRAVSGAPRFDYSMVDDDFLLLPVFLDYAKVAGPERSNAFLSRKTTAGVTYREALGRNTKLVMKMVKPFALKPVWKNLVAIKAGLPAGQWRDSGEGLGGGRYAYDVNAALVPAALSAIAHLVAHTDWGCKDEALAVQAKSYAEIWSSKAPPLFAQTVDKEKALASVARYANDLGLAPFELDGRNEFSALALDKDGKAIPVMHSDEGFRLLFNQPDARSLLNIANLLLRPFPYGLATPIGMLVANPVFAATDIQKKFTRSHYHGTVVWSWQHALMAAGLDRQLARQDLDIETRAKLSEARLALWSMIRASDTFRAAELWSWKLNAGKISYVSYGQSEADQTESNPNQGWSHAFLGLKEQR